MPTNVCEASRQQVCAAIAAAGCIRNPQDARQAQLAIHFRTFSYSSDLPHTMGVIDQVDLSKTSLETIGVFRNSSTRGTLIRHDVGHPRGRGRHSSAETSGGDACGGWCGDEQLAGAGSKACDIIRDCAQFTKRRLRFQGNGLGSLQCRCIPNLDPKLPKLNQTVDSPTI